jgi:hypothetical protein
MGMAGIDITSPSTAAIINSLLNTGSYILPKMKLGRIEELKPRSSVPGAKHTRFYYGPLKIESLDV